MRRPPGLLLGILALSLGLPGGPAAAQVAPCKLAEADLAIDGLSAEVEGANSGRAEEHGFGRAGDGAGRRAGADRGSDSRSRATVNSKPR